jgi:hypothetical protein
MSDFVIGNLSSGFLSPEKINEFTAVGVNTLSAVAISGFLEIKHIQIAVFTCAVLL